MEHDFVLYPFKRDLKIDGLEYDFNIDGTIDPKDLEKLDMEYLEPFQDIEICLSPYGCNNEPPEVMLYVDIFSSIACSVKLSEFLERNFIDSCEEEELEAVEKLHSSLEKIIHSIKNNIKSINSLP